MILIYNNVRIKYIIKKKVDHKIMLRENWYPFAARIANKYKNRTKIYCNLENSLNFPIHKFPSDYKVSTAAKKNVVEKL